MLIYTRLLESFHNILMPKTTAIVHEIEEMVRVVVLLCKKCAAKCERQSPCSVTL